MVAAQNSSNLVKGDGSAPDEVRALNDQADRCRRLAGVTYNREISEILGNLADDYQRSAAEFSRKPGA